MGSGVRCVSWWKRSYEAVVVWHGSGGSGRVLEVYFWWRVYWSESRWTILDRLAVRVQEDDTWGGSGTGRSKVRESIACVRVTW